MSNLNENEKELLLKNLDKLLEIQRVFFKKKIYNYSIKISEIYIELFKLL
jgi:hypothetical protein